MTNHKQYSKVNSITLTSLLSALSTILFFIGGPPIILSLPYIKIDLSDVPALIGAMIISPKAGLIIEFIKNFIHLFNTRTFCIGEFISLVIGSTIILSFTHAFKKSHQKHGLKFSIFISYLICVVTTIFIALIVNSVLFPISLKIFSPSTIITKNIMITYLISVFIINFFKVSITILISVLLIKRKHTNLLN